MLRPLALSLALLLAAAALAADRTPPPEGAGSYFILQLLLADQNHLSFDPPVVSEKITITVA